jgi:hypothetical protein
MLAIGLTAIGLDAVQTARREAKVRDLLTVKSDWHVIGEAADGIEAIRLNVVSNGRNHDISKERLHFHCT